jgi:lysyl-tRNA synthetase class 2
MGDPVSLESSLLSSAAYSDDRRLQLSFRNGTIYQYFDVPPDVFQSLLAAESKGQYFNRHIRDQFHHDRLA